MAKITDSQGKQWGLMASKDAMGRIYVRAYQNKWDVQKSRSYVAAKVQVGRLRFLISREQDSYVREQIS